MIKDLRQTPEYAKYMRLLGWKVLRLNKDYLYTKKIPLVGWVGKFQRPQKAPTPKQVKSLSLSVFYLEPQSLLLPKFHRAKSTFLPSKTIHIDLTQSEKKLFNRLKSKARYNVGLATRRSVVIRKSTDIAGFAKLWQKTSRKRGTWLSQQKEIKALWEAFEDSRDLLLAYKDWELLGGVLLCYSPHTAYYMYAGNTQHGKQLFAPSLLVWEAIRLAKNRGKKIFDFEGVYDSRYKSTKSWRGFTKFKEGFGGKVIEHPPTLVWYKNPFLRLLNF